MKASNVRKGVVIMYNGAPHRIMDFHHHTPGNLRAMVQTKMRNLLSGNQTEVRFSSTEELEEANVNTAGATYLYADHSGYHFMYKESFEEITLDEEYLAKVSFTSKIRWKSTLPPTMGNAIGINLPQTVILRVAETDPEGLRGATASNSPKPAKTDTGCSAKRASFC